jgi:GT2 family glycosyltransferase
VAFQPQQVTTFSPSNVSIVIPFRDQVELLERCVLPLYHTVHDAELILVDNGSQENRTKSFMHRCRLLHKAQVVHLDEPFNFSRLCNAGAAVSHREFLLFLNNDVLTEQPAWLEAMLECAGDPRVGIVGATLLYPDRTIQHAGLFPTGPGKAWEHPYRNEPETHPGKDNELRHIRTVPAVTGACLLIRRSIFETVDGFDPRFPVTMNDVDLCQRVKAQGWEVTITPFARLVHFESLSRGYQREVA